MADNNKLADELAQISGLCSIERDRETIIKAAAAIRSQPGTLAREEVVSALVNHFKSVIEASAGMPFAETEVALPLKSFEGYTDAILALTPSHEAGTQYDPAFVKSILDADAKPPEATFANAADALSYLNDRPEAGTQDEAEQVCAEAYQVVGSMLSDLGQFDTERATKILDNLSQAKMVHDDVLPWPSFEAGTQEPVTWRPSQEELERLIYLHMISCTPRTAKQGAHDAAKIVIANLYASHEAGTQEPVAWRYKDNDDADWLLAYSDPRVLPNGKIVKWDCVDPLYAAPASHGATREALFEPETAHAGWNLEGALHDIRRLSEAGKPTDAVCIRTIERVCKQLFNAEAALTPTLRGEGEEHPILKQCDELHDLGFNADWCGAIEECAKLIEQQQERISETSNGSERSLSPRMAGNQMGLAYAAGLRPLRGVRVQAGSGEAEAPIGHQAVAHSGTHLGYKDSSGNEMHCANAFCPHEKKCSRGCVNRVARPHAPPQMSVEKGK